MAQALYGMGVIVGPTLGPPLGGYIVDNFSWPYIFYINVPLGIIAVLMTLSLVKSPRYGAKQAAKDVDWWGMIFLIMFIGSLQFVLEHGQQDDWFEDSTILTLTIMSFFGLFFFIWRELTYANPIVNLRVLKDKNLQVGTVMSFILGFGLFGSTFIIPIYTQSILGWTATDAGMLLIPSSIMTGIMMPFIGKMIQRGVPQKYMVAVGLCIFFGYSFLMYGLITNDTGSEHMFVPLIIRGVGLGLLFVPVMTLSLSTLEGKAIGEGASFTGMSRQLGGSFGIALITTYISRDSQSHRVDLIGNLDATKFEIQQRIAQMQASFVSKGFSPNEALSKAHQLLDGAVTKQATILSYMDVFLYLGLLFLICVPFVLLIKQGKKQNVDMSNMH